MGGSTPQHEFRRSKNPAKIYSLCFNSTGEHLLCSSDRGTIHIFSVKSSAPSPVIVPDPFEGARDHPKRTDKLDKPTDKPSEAKNSTSFFSFASAILPDYFRSEWSFCQIRLPTTSPHVATFGPIIDDKHSVYVVCKDGKFYHIRYTLDGKYEMSTESF